MFVTTKTASRIIREQKNQDKSVALISGCFDLFHPGHLSLFRFAQKQADLVVVALEQDATIKNSKGDCRPLMNLDERADMLTDIASIDLITEIPEEYSFSDPDADQIQEDFNRALGIDVLVTTASEDLYQKEKQRRAKRLGIKFRPHTLAHHLSTSKIIERIQGK